MRVRILKVGKWYLIYEAVSTVAMLGVWPLAIRVFS
jgi:hypothetical protein